MAEPRIDEAGLPVYAPGDYDYVRVVDRSTGASRNALAPEVTAAARAISEALDGLVDDARADIDELIAGLGYLAPVPYDTGLDVEDIKFTVSYNGDVYAPKPELVPFTTGTWNPDQWNVIQGDINLRSDLADPTGGGALVAFRQAGDGAVLRDVGSKSRESVSVLDYIPVSEHAAIWAGTSNFDCLPAFQAALAYQRPSSSQGASYGAAGPSIYVPAGTYRLSGPLEIKRRVVIYGDGSGAANSSEASVLKFDANSHGIVVHAHNTIGDGVETPATTQGAGSILRGLHLVGSQGSTGHGVWLRARAAVADFRIDGFAGNGIHIHAIAGAGDIREGNANNFNLDTIRITNVGGHGVYVKGADANAGVGIGIDCSGCGRGGIWDESFLGNTWIACHTAVVGRAGGQVSHGGSRYFVMDDTNGGSTEPGTNSAVWRLIGPGGPHTYYPAWVSGQSYQRGHSYFCNNPNAASVFLGCYTENDGVPSRIQYPAVVVGGLFNAVMPESTGGFFGSRSNIRNAFTGSAGARFSRSSDGAVFESVLVSNIQNGEFLSMYDSKDHPLSWRFRSTGGNLHLDYGNSQLGFAVTGPNTTLTFGTGSPVPYAFNLASLYLGQGLNARRQTTGTAPPTTGAWGRGSVVWNINAAPGGFAGWICTGAGTPGTWKGFGAIEA